LIINKKNVLGIFLSIDFCFSSLLLLYCYELYLFGS
jgi:hypothetical protein